MDALMDFDFIDVATTAPTGDTPVAPNNQNNQPSTSCSTSSQDQCEMAATHAKLVQDLTVVVEQSLEKFENRIASRVVSEIGLTQQNHSVNSSASCTNSTGSGSSSNAQSQCGPSPIPLPVHQDVYCDHCNTVIVGVRYKCGMCKDYDLCERCESQRPHQQRSHLFIKMYEPLSASLNAQPLLSQPELVGNGAGVNPFVGFLGSLGLPAGTEATLEVVREDDVEIEIRELAQANGCQFYLSDNGHRLCKDYQVINRSSRNIQSGDYHLEHVFSSGLHPFEAEVAVPEIPEGDVRILCLSWQAPQSAQSPLLLLGSELAEAGDGDDSLSPTQPRPLRQAYSVYRLKDRRGCHIGEPLNASLTLIQLDSSTGVNRRSSGTTASAVQTDIGNDEADNSFELISDDELPSCFVLESRIDRRIDNCENSATRIVDSQEDNAAEACLVDLANSSLNLQSPPPPPPRVASAAQQQQQQQQCGDSTTSTSATMVTKTTVATASSSTSAASASSVAAKLLSESQSDRIHPSMLRAASYVPKTSQWVPPPQQQPPPPPPRAEHLSDISSSSSSDIWGPRGEQSERLQLQKLLEMGFYRREVNARVLRETNGDFEAALNQLSRMYEEF